MQPEALCWLWQQNLGKYLRIVLSDFSWILRSAHGQPCVTTSYMLNNLWDVQTLNTMPYKPARVSVSLMSYVKPWKLWLWSVTSPFPPPSHPTPSTTPPFTSVCPQVVRQHTGPSSAPPLLLYFPISLFLKTFSLFLLLSPLFDILPIAPLRCHYT